MLLLSIFFFYLVICFEIIRLIWMHSRKSHKCSKKNFFLVFLKAFTLPFLCAYFYSNERNHKMRTRKRNDVNNDYVKIKMKCFIQIRYYKWNVGKLWFYGLFFSRSQNWISVRILKWKTFLLGLFACLNFVLFWLLCLDRDLLVTLMEPKKIKWSLFYGICRW